MVVLSIFGGVFGWSLLDWLYFKSPKDLTTLVA